MDIAMILKKVHAGQYGTLEECMADMRLMWSNACIFNKPNSQVGTGRGASVQHTRIFRYTSVFLLLCVCVCVCVCVFHVVCLYVTAWDWLSLFARFSACL